MARRRVVVIREEYRVTRHSPPPLPPPTRDDGGGGWFATLVGFGLCFLIVLGIEKLTDGHASPPVKETGRQVVIETRITSGNRCIVQGVSINGRAQPDLLADSGAPDMWFPVGDLPRLNITRSGLDFRPFGAREGNVAWVTLDTVRIGDFVARNVQAGIADGREFHWRLLGMSVLRQGHMEIRGDTCTLTFPRNA
jgi:predicted aspartyl protease